LERFAKANPGALQPVVLLQQDQGATDTLVRKWPAPEDRVAMHQSYSMQWFGMAAALLIFTAWPVCARKIRHDTPDR